MNYIYLLGAVATLAPLRVDAQGIQTVITNSTSFIDSTLIPFLFGMTFLVFIINAIRFFVLQSTSEDGRENARNLLTYSVLAFVFLIIFWGIINLLSGSLGFEGVNQPVSDYQDLNNGGSGTPSDCSNGGPC